MKLVSLVRVGIFSLILGFQICVAEPLPDHTVDEIIETLSGGSLQKFLGDYKLRLTPDQALRVLTKGRFTWTWDKGYSNGIFLDAREAGFTASQFIKFAHLFTLNTTADSRILGYVCKRVRQLSVDEVLLLIHECSWTFTTDQILIQYGEINNDRLYAEDYDRLLEKVHGPLTEQRLIQLKAIALLADRCARTADGPRDAQ